MKSVTLYHSIKEKKQEQENTLDGYAALILTLEIMDFNAALLSKNKNVTFENDGIEWIELEMKKK